VRSLGIRLSSQRLNKIKFRLGYFSQVLPALLNCIDANILKISGAIILVNGVFIYANTLTRIYGFNLSVSFTVCYSPQFEGRASGCHASDVEGSVSWISQTDEIPVKGFVCKSTSSRKLFLDQSLE